MEEHITEDDWMDEVLEEAATKEREIAELRKTLKFTNVKSDFEFYKLATADARNGRCQKELDLEFDEREDYKEHIAKRKKGKQTGGMMGKAIADKIKKESFVMQNMKALAPIYKELSHAEAGVYFKLFNYVKYNEDLIQDRNGSMSIKTMSEALNIKRSALNNYLSVLVKKGLIIKEGVNRGVKFKLNSEYVINGKQKSNVAFNKVFTNPMESCFKDEALQKLDLRHLGFLIKLSMHIDLHTLVLANDPYVKDVKDLAPMNVKDIVKAMGDSRRTVERYMDALGDAKILKWFNIGFAGQPAEVAGFFIDPLVISRGRGQHKSNREVVMEFSKIKREGYMPRFERKVKY